MTSPAANTITPEDEPTGPNDLSSLLFTVNFIQFNAYGLFALISQYFGNRIVLGHMVDRSEFCRVA